MGGYLRRRLRSELSEEDYIQRAVSLYHAEKDRAAVPPVFDDVGKQLSLQNAAIAYQTIEFSESKPDRWHDA